MGINFPGPARYQKNPHDIETESNIKTEPGKLFDRFYFRHDLGDSEKHTDAGRKQRDTPY
jgi:hypothetical protein